MNNRLGAMVQAVKNLRPTLTRISTSPAALKEGESVIGSSFRAWRWIDELAPRRRYGAV
jgi:hypothetical protein